MDKIKIIGGNQLNGKIYISGAKNAALPLICAALLTNDKVILKNVPALSDITFLNGLLKYLGIKISEKEELFESHISTTYTYQADEIKELIAPYDFVRKMRASYYVLGPLLARFRHAELSLPGGCAIGARPIDIHLSSLEQMGAKIEIKNGYVVADAPEGLSGAHIIFSKASVGATCNILMAATLANGTTRIENAAKEPEISNLIDLLNLMGAKIEGRDTSILTIKELHGAELPVVSDRIEAGSYAIAAAITHGRIELVNARSEHLQQPLRVLEKMGVGVEEKEHSIIIDGIGKTIVGEDIYTDYYPGFPTDLQAQFMALMTVANGASLRKAFGKTVLCMCRNFAVWGQTSIFTGMHQLSSAALKSFQVLRSWQRICAPLLP